MSLSACTLFTHFSEPWAFIIDQLIKEGYADETVESNVANEKSFDLGFITCPPHHYNLKDFKIQITYFKDGPGTSETIFSYLLGIRNHALIFGGTMFQGTHYLEMFPTFLQQGRIDYNMLSQQIKQIDKNALEANSYYLNASDKPKRDFLPASFSADGPSVGFCSFLDKTYNQFRITHITRLSDDLAIQIKNAPNQKQAKGHQSQGGNGGGGCFITTAICTSLNKPDDCYELTLLRSFRDKKLLTNNQYQPLVHQYYQIAPRIVEFINQSSTADEIYLSLYEDYLVDCIENIEKGYLHEAVRIYSNMIKDISDSIDDI